MIRFRPELALIVAFLVACPNNPNPVTPPGPPTPPAPPPNTTPTPAITPPGTPDGSPSTWTINNFGGTAKTEGSRPITLTFPKDVVTNANVTLQPITDTLNGAGKGVAISSNEAWSKYVKISFPIEPSDDSPEGLGLAVQQADGSWRVLEPIKVDLKAGTVSAALPADTEVNAANLRPQAGLNLKNVVKFKRFYLKPSSATVKVGNTRSFVPYAQVLEKEAIPGCKQPPPPTPTGDPDIDELAPLAKICTRKVTREYAFTNNKPGFIRLWAVNAEAPGNSTIGTISPTSPSGATYTAPNKKPSPDTVTVTFQSLNNDTGDDVTLSAKVKITDSAEGSIRITVKGSKTENYGGGTGSERTTVDLTYDLTLKTAPPITGIPGSGYFGTYELTPQVSGTVTHNGVYKDSGFCDICRPELGKFNTDNNYDGSSTITINSADAGKMVYTSLQIPQGQISGELSLPSLPGFTNNGQGSGKIAVTGCKSDQRTLTDPTRLESFSYYSTLGVTASDPSQPGRLAGSVTLFDRTVSVNAPNSRYGTPTTWSVPVTITIEYDLPYNPTANSMQGAAPTQQMKLEVGNPMRGVKGHASNLEPNATSQPSNMVWRTLPLTPTQPDARTVSDGADQATQRRWNAPLHGQTLELMRPGLGQVERCGQAPPTQ